ncbi:unnamed protein product [Durusdinium trenchii]|uniref:Uncharacterized protein n=1 Tax=Durusdinium trenchii TaxID=1381693 RepID=A0ABP0LVZ0_9DINO
MVFVPVPGEALARDFLKLEARKEDLEEKRWKFMEEMQNRHTVDQHRRAASLSVLEKRIRSEEKQHSLLKERNVVIRQQAASLSNPINSEVMLRIRAYRERFALDAERQSLDWHRHIETQLREEIENCRRDAQHCRMRQGEAIEVAMQQEKLMAELAEAQSQAQEERARLYEDVKMQQDRLRQRLWEQRHLMDDRVKALTSPPQVPREANACSQTLAPQEVMPHLSATALPELPGAQGARAERTLTRAPPPAAQRTLKKTSDGGYVPKEGTRQAEVYHRLLRTEAEMAAELRLMEDRLVLRCQCGFVGTPPGPPNGLCETCGNLLEVLRVPPKIAQGPIFQSAKQTLPMHSTMSAKVFSTPVPPPSFTVRGGLSTEGIKGSVPRAEAGPPVLPDEPMDLAKAHAMALRSLERLAARREMNAKEGEAGDQTCESGHSPTRVEAVVEEAAAPSIRSSDQLDAFPGAQRAAGAEGEAEGSVGRWEGLEAQELSGDGLLGGLDILTTPVAPLQTFSLGHSGHSGHGSARGPPRDPLRHISDDAREWYGGSSGSATPKPDLSTKLEKEADTSSAEEVPFVERSPSKLEDEASAPAVLAAPAALATPGQPLAATVAQAVSARACEGKSPSFTHSPHTGSEIRPRETQVDLTDSKQMQAAPQEEAKLPTLALSVAETSPVPETPLVPDPLREAEATPAKPKNLAAKEDMRPSDPIAQAGSPDGSFTFGVGSSPPEVPNSQPPAEKVVQDEASALPLRPVQPPPAATSTATSMASEGQPSNEKPVSQELPPVGTQSSAQKDLKMMSDLGLEEGSEDPSPQDAKDKEESPSSPSLGPVALSIGKQVPKRSNPLARSRGSGLFQAGGDFDGPGLSRGLGGLSQVSSLSKTKAKPKSSSLFGGPIDWNQKEDFR